ncbi:MAG: NADH-quinone oxidoreductase subunit K [Crenarchaeota archaeon]|nr:NADH-quinone oxidoreductase subunit K [Thermoproteota archaeon]
MSELGGALWATIPLLVVGLYGIAARRNLVRIMLALEIVGAATVTMLGAAAAAKWQASGEVLGLLALVAVGIEGALLIALATLFNEMYGDMDVIVLKEGGEEK